MGSSLDLHNTSSLGQRRQAASNLPQFELPPPSNLQFAAQQLGHKFPPLTIASHGHPPPSVSVGNLLTPPSNSASESGASSANLPQGSNANGQAVPVLPYTPTFWGPGNTPNGFNTGLTPQPWQNHPLYSRSMFSPGIGRNNSHSPAIGEHSSLPPPPYELNHAHSYPSTMGMPSPAINAHTSTAQQHQQQQQQQHQQQQQQQHHQQQQQQQHHQHHQQQQHQQQQQQHHHQQMMSMMPVRQQSQTSPISPNDGVSKSSSTPSLYQSMSASNTPQPPQYGFQNSTPVSQSPHPSHQSTSRPSPPLHQNSSGQQPLNHFIKPPYPSYTLPAMPGAIMTNINSPGGQMSMLGSMPSGMYNIPPSGYTANPQPMYSHQRGNSPQQSANTDRPFKCDQCPQSFNRNHDLKRHKRIHLAVKPFPCKHCDKSFSRKDALKGVATEVPIIQKPNQKPVATVSLGKLPS